MTAPSTRVPRLATAELTTRDGRDRFLREAFLTMRPAGMGKHTPGRFLFDDMRREGRTCWRQLTAAMELAAAHGVSRERLSSFALALLAYAEHLADQRAALKGDFVRPMSCLLIDEATVGARADVAQTRLLVEESPAALAEVIETSERHSRVLSELAKFARLALCRLHLARGST